VSRDPIGYQANDTSQYRYLDSSPLTYVDPTGQCCCCCVVALETPDNPPKISREGEMGHEFTVTAQLDYPGNAGSTEDCTLEWWEKANISVGMEIPRREHWFDQYDRFPDSALFGDWNNRDKPCAGSEPARIPDTPKFSLRGGRTIHRVVFFTIRVTSAKGCMCAVSSITISAVQVLVANGGIPDWGSSEFRITSRSSTAASGQYRQFVGLDF
jgi:hypothetical protein